MDERCEYRMSNIRRFIANWSKILSEIWFNYFADNDTWQWHVSIIYLSKILSEIFYNIESITIHGTLLLVVNLFGKKKLTISQQDKIELLKQIMNGCVQKSIWLSKIWNLFAWSKICFRAHHLLEQTHFMGADALN